mgnify:CR=1 FL=1
MRAHRCALILEVVLPIISTCLCGFMTYTLLNLSFSNYGNNGWWQNWSPYCVDQVYVTPTHALQNLERLKGSCVQQRTVYPFPNATAMNTQFVQDAIGRRATSWQPTNYWSSAWMIDATDAEVPGACSMSATTGDVDMTFKPVGSTRHLATTCPLNVSLSPGQGSWVYAIPQMVQAVLTPLARWYGANRTEWPPLQPWQQNQIMFNPSYEPSIPPYTTFIDGSVQLFYNEQRVQSGSSRTQSVNVITIFATGGTVILIFGFLPMTSAVTGRLVDEKRQKVREHLRVLGVTSFAYVMSSMLTAMLRVGVATVARCAIFFGFFATYLSVGDILFVTLVCFLLGLALCGWAQIIPAFISKTQYSNALCGAFIIVSCAGSPYVTLAPVPVQRLACALLSPVAALYAIAPVLAQHSVTLPVGQAESAMWLVWGILFYTALGQYVYNINPGEYGVAQHPLFPMYALVALCRRTKRRSGGSLMSTDSTGYEDAERGEGSAARDASKNHSRVTVKGLTKFFGNQRDTPAVDHIDLDIYKGEIFALLGHNGAGKTTTISMLTGMTAATDYRQATVEGYDLATEMDAIRRSLGSCPQFDVLFDDLSGKQHMELFAAIKNVPAARGTDLLTGLGLPLTDQRSSTFSGGMKRRLSVATALVGDAPVIFLDEPSSGLDPVSRRHMWDLLLQERRTGKTIVLTTHFMEEADYLGDRVAIMSHGKVYCCDTSANLKRRYGVGYYLTFAKRHSGGDDVDDLKKKAANYSGDFRLTEVTQLLTRHCGGALNQNAPLPENHVGVDATAGGQVVLQNDGIGEARFLLPLTAADAFPALFADLDHQLDSLGIASYGLSMNSLEDVFLTIADREAAERAQKKAASQPTAASSVARNAVTAADPLQTLGPHGLSPRTLFVQALETGYLRMLVNQTIAMLVKQGLMTWRRKKTWFLGLFLPMVVIGVSFLSAIDLNAFMGGGGYNYYNVYGSAMPNPVNLRVPVVMDSMAGTPYMDRTIVDGVLGEFSDAYADYLTYVQFGRSNARPNATEQAPSLQLPTYEGPMAGQMGAYVDAGNLAFGFEVHTPAVLRISQAYHWTNSTPGANPAAGVNITYFWNYDPKRWGIAGLVELDLAWNMAVRRWSALTANAPVGSAAANAIVNVSVNWLPLLPPYNATTTTTQTLTSTTTTTVTETTGTGTMSPTATTTSTNAPEGPYTPRYIMLGVGILSVAAIVQFASSQALVVADDVNRYTFQTLRMHGLRGAAYWLGTYLFDMLMAVLLLIAFVAGVYGQNLVTFQTAGNLILCFVSFLLTCSFALLICFAIVVFMPHNCKPSTYVAATTGIMYLFMVVPYITFATIVGTTDVDVSSLDWIEYLSPPRCFLGVLGYVAGTPPAPFTDANWNTQHIQRLLGFALLWHVLPIGLLLFYTYPEVFRSASWRLTSMIHVNTLLPSRGGSTSFTDMTPTAPLLNSGTAVRTLSADPDVAAEEARVGQELLQLSKSGTTPPTVVVGGAPTALDTVMAVGLQKVYRATHSAIKRQEQEETSAISPTAGAAASAVPPSDPAQKRCCGVCEPKVDKVAVDGVTFGVQRGECFGLLGPNGSGKTTTVRMMLLQEAATRGAPVYPSGVNQTSPVCGEVLSRDDCYAFARLGVCQQHDSLWEALDAREHMHLYLRVRLGPLYDYTLWTPYVEEALKRVKLAEDAGDKLTMEYSGGMKRKLAVCLAMYTGSMSVFLDEPSTGMDPYARRALWSVIQDSLQHDGSVLLTTHSMEEADSVCARIGILVSGTMRCLGTSQRLKNRFGAGYNIVVTLPLAASGDEGGAAPSVAATSATYALDDAQQAAALAIDAVLASRLGSSCALRESVGNQRRYVTAHLPSLSVPFRCLDELKRAGTIRDFTVTQSSSLEQIFIDFATSQQTQT